MTVLAIVGCSHEEQNWEELTNDRPIEGVYIAMNAPLLEGRKEAMEAIEAALVDAGYLFTLDKSHCPPSDGKYSLCFAPERNDDEIARHTEGLDQGAIDVVGEQHIWPYPAYVRNGVAAIIIGSASNVLRIAFVPPKRGNFCDEDLDAMYSLPELLNASPFLANAHFGVAPSAEPCVAGKEVE